MEALDRIVATLSDGYWHEVLEIEFKTNVDINKLGKALKFLKDYGFIHLSKDSAKLTDEMRTFQHDIRDLEN